MFKLINLVTQIFKRQERMGRLVRIIKDFLLAQVMIAPNLINHMTEIELAYTVLFFERWATDSLDKFHAQIYLLVKSVHLKTCLVLAHTLFGLSVALEIVLVLRVPIIGSLALRAKILLIIVRVISFLIFLMWLFVLIRVHFLLSTQTSS